MCQTLADLLDLAMWRLLVILKDTVSVTRWGQRIERVEKMESVKGEIVNIKLSRSFQSWRYKIEFGFFLIWGVNTSCLPM